VTQGKGRRAPIVQERLIAAPPEAVFDAWGDAASLRRWMCPGDTRRTEVELDFWVGGRFRIVMHGEREFVQHGEYLEIDRPRRLVFTWISDFVSPDEARTRVTVTFAPAASGATLVRLVHDELPDTDTYDRHVQGWADILRKLETTWT
jgi:uncharacterized protein YndB with AHSA1/START domain